MSGQPDWARGKLWRMTVIVAVIGGPGSGKSTLCATVARHYTAAGKIVDHFEEEHILSRPAFSTVASEFADGAGTVNARTLIDAFGRYVNSVDDQTDLVITDALIPFIPSLLASGHTEAELEQTIADLENAAADNPVIVVLMVADPALTLPRAIAREGDEWADHYVQKLSRWPGTSHVTSLASAIDQLRYEADLSRRLLTRSGWELIQIDATAPCDIQVDVVERRLDTILQN